MKTNEKSKDQAIDGTASPVVKINRNFTKVDNMPIKHLQRWLEMLEPVACSEQMMKLVVRRGSYQDSHRQVSEIFECVTGIAPGTPLFGGKCGDDVDMEVFEAKLVNEYHSGDRRGRNLRLEPDWAGRDGWYTEEKLGIPLHQRAVGNETLDTASRHLCR